MMTALAGENSTLIKLDTTAGINTGDGISRKSNSIWDSQFQPMTWEKH